MKSAKMKRLVSRSGAPRTGRSRAPKRVKSPPPIVGLPATLTAAQLAPMVNAYTIKTGPKTIVVPGASKLAALQDITVSGQLLNKQRVAYDLRSNARSVTISGGGGYTKQEADGDLHFCLGPKQGQPHIACELQRAAPWIAAFNAARDRNITVTGFFRCLFEHPGFQINDDAHIFEIHPVRAVNLSGSIQPFDVSIPDQKATHTWKIPFDLNVQDSKTTASYDKAKDTLTFTNMDGRDENYVAVSGAVSNIRLSPTPPTPSRFTLTSADIAHPVEVLALHGTSAERQLNKLTGANVKMIGLRNIDLSEALKNRYVISLLAIDIQPG